MRQFLMASVIVSMILPGFGLSLSAQTSLPTPQASPSAPAATIDVYFLSRAKNLARQSAINANGGLVKYRPDPVMFGPAVQTPYVRNADGSITFTFNGGAPGATPSIETAATVLPDGSVKLEYNGVIRNGSNPAPTVASPPPIPSPSASPVTLPTTPPPDPFLPPVSAGATPSSSPTPVPAPVIPSSPPPAPQGSSERNWVDQDAFFSKARNLARQAAIKINGGLDKYRPETSMFGPSAQTPFVKNSDGSLTFKFKGGAPSSTQMTIESEVVVSPTGNVEMKYNGPVR